MSEIGSAGFIYLVLALELHSAFPPFYRRKNGLSVFSDDEIKRVVLLLLPYFLAMFVAIAAMAVTGEAGVFFPALGLVGFLGGIRLRRNLSKISNGPEPWITNIWISKWSVWALKWPMLVFDVWTVGICLMFVLLI